MREIKFRAWNTKKKCFLHSFDFAISGDGDIYRYTRSIEEDGYIHLENDLEIMEYTGLLDKKGVEIYEGDIVTYIVDGTNNKIWQNKIAWENGCLIIKNEDAPPIMDDGLYDIEVIGNIYENPELLEDRQ